MNMNEFNMQVVKGLIDLRNGGGAPVSCQADATSGTLVPGQAVKLVPSNNRGIPRVVACTVDTDDVFGFVVYDVKSSSFIAGDRLEVLPMRNGVMYMEANAALPQGSEVALFITGQKVIVATSTDRIVGRAIDGASASGKLIRVQVDLPGTIKA